VFIAARVSRIVFQWVCLEINILSFIPLLIRGGAGSDIVVGIKYFISQRVASLLFISVVVVNLRVVRVEIVTAVVILFKLGVPPFHSWLISILEFIKPLFIFITLTIQKLVPLFILSQLKISQRVGGLFLIVGVIFILLCLNRVRSFFTLIFLSSVVNTLWILISLTSGGSWFSFIIIYSVLLLSLIFCVRSILSFKVVDVTKLGGVEGRLLSFNFLNLGGLPPLAGFLAKIILIKRMIRCSLLIIFSLVLSSLLLLYLYVVFRYQAYSLTKKPSSSRVVGGSDFTPRLTVSLLCRGLVLWLLK